MNTSIQHTIDKASKIIGDTWPLYTFVASNPLSGYENAPFKEAVLKAKEQLTASVFPDAKLYRQAWNKGEIDKEIISELLKYEGFTDAPEMYLEHLEAQQPTAIVNENNKLDRVMSKWLAAFMDEGLAEWSMPFKTEGFYNSWRHLVIYDDECDFTSLKEIPKSPKDVFDNILKDFKEEEYIALFTYHLAALPGWTGYINHRQKTNSDWQQHYPITIEEYLAARLWTAKHLDIPLLKKVEQDTSQKEIAKLQYIWLKAWEASWQKDLVHTVAKQTTKATDEKSNKPDAQFVFCIDTRSELIRRHVESKGDYETYGYAGFFGITMDYESLEDGITRKACPPIVASGYTVSEKAQTGKDQSLAKYKSINSIDKFKVYFLKRMKNMLPSAFGYVEGSGLYYGVSMIIRTLFPGKAYTLKSSKQIKTESFCEPSITKIDSQDTDGIPLAERVGIVKSSFNLMGWKQFAKLVLFVGHGSHTANNPFGSSLDCGACAATPGRNNARMLAKLANQPDVREELSSAYGIQIPEDTVFIGAEHNTTTDHIELFDAEVPESHLEAVAVVKRNLSLAQETATQDRLGNSQKSIAKAHQKANNWAETRPEWGLAKNAGFIVGQRDLTKNTNLGSRCFLHSYNWELDKEGKALEGIMQGPMVVTQWINNHYYFSTVDNETFGGGSKITHNITGKFGVVQGNGGDLKMGLPLQSLYDADDLMYHQPLRLSVMIEAPVRRVSEILTRNENLRMLLDNEWIYLMVVDPTQQNVILRYQKSIQWETVWKKNKNVRKENKTAGQQKLAEEISM
ncbi:DUF2309 domain-containing protein [Aquimarina brevivitae]|uniref:Probable inorganic carbon transporter subunit DabA n=1 Tax=Aquimarina brevivitae TaxID=323412 RepID=A0A4V2F5S1_9FLAO|nr:DUF2309 domain-containing protein [Aquimarina brevivitae]RZS93799.1 hypothetical protein EV197_2380 [Aquimarina brevivitae]